MEEKIYLASDHAGFEMKKKVKSYLEEVGQSFEDVGCDSEERCDYPDFAHKAAQKILQTGSKGIFICGSGNGINMAANKHAGIRSALCWKEELAEMARAHNDANVMALPGRYISEEVALKCVEKFLNTPFEGGRHEERVNKIENEN